MSIVHISRRALALGLSSIPAALSVAGRALGADSMAAAPSDAAAGLSHSSESIHQEITFNAGRRRVYAALTDAKQFDAVTRLSDAIELVTAPGAKPTTISHEVGGSFTLFGGYVTGRHLQLLPDERLVQAWHAASWKPADYSIVRFELFEDGAATKLKFDHRGFPDGQGTHLADGWHVHYWQPLAKYLSQA